MRDKTDTALSTVLEDLEKQYGQGTVMRLGEASRRLHVQVILRAP